VNLFLLPREENFYFQKSIDRFYIFFWQDFILKIFSNEHCATHFLQKLHSSKT